jgi:hypothetical protein
LEAPSNRMRGMTVRAGLLAMAAATWLAAAPGAQAATVNTDCANLQAALDNAATGDTIVLTQLCTATNSGGSGGTFSLGSGAHDSRSYTLTGQPGSGAGFDGTGVGTRMLSANNSTGDPTASLTISNLVFKNASPPPLDGGALAFQGDYSVNLSGDTFTDNLAPAADPGAPWPYRPKRPTPRSS